MSPRILLTPLLLLILLAAHAHAGGPLLVGSPAFGVDGKPFVWDTSQPVGYRVDTGALGSWSNSTATAHLQTAFSTWTSVPTTALAVSQLGPLLGVSGGHVASVQDFDTVVASCNSGKQSPIVFDSDGSVFQQIIGDDSVVGFTSACRLSESGHIQSALSVFTGGAGLSGVQQDQVMLHELGHFFGLDHSLPGTNQCGTSADDLAALPIMYYQISSRVTLSVDDKAWISFLYPGPTYASTYGVISGQIFFSDGQSPVQDVLVSAHPSAPGTLNGDDRSQAWSVISGYRFTGNPGQSITADYLACTPASACPHGFYGYNAGGSSFGSRAPALLGAYELPVPAGVYSVQISGLLDGGVLGPNQPTIPLPGPGEYWNPQESATDFDFTKVNCLANQQLSYVTVQAGATLPNIDVIMNGTAPTFDYMEGSSASSTPQSRQVPRP